jgi:uncharacterized protein with FMN-binding domain
MNRVRAAVSLAGTAAGLGLLLSFRVPSSAPATAAAPPASSSTPSPAASSTPSAAAPSGSGSPTPTASGLRDGSFTGQTFTNFYGPVQVRVTISGGRITNVTTVQEPADNPQSEFIFSQAAPTLREEVLKAQSAQIDVVSGATFDSQSYAQSVQSALDQARA